MIKNDLIKISSMIRINEGINHYVSLNEIMQDGIEHNASSNVTKQDGINALILFHTYFQNFCLVFYMFS